MTEVRFFRGKGGELGGFVASGHSGYGDYGEDIVCAAVSALTQGILNGIEDVAKVPIDKKMSEDAALLYCKIEDRATAEEMDRAQLLLETLYQAVAAIAMDYPVHVTISFEDWGK